MKKDKHYTKEVSKIRAIALSFYPEKLTNHNLAKALLISEEGRRLLATSFSVPESQLRKIDYIPERKVKDDPQMEWPFENLDFDSALIDEETESEPEKINMTWNHCLVKLKRQCLMIIFLSNPFQPILHHSMTY